MTLNISRLATHVTMPRFIYIHLATLGLCTLLLGCASTKIETSRAERTDSLCQSAAENLSALVLWGPIWRPNQKEVPLREAAAQQGIESYFASSGCFSKVEIRRLPDKGAVPEPSTRELLSLASVASPPPDRLLVIAVRELGPVIKLLNSPAIVEGGTEAVLELTAINLRTNSPPVSFRVHWQNGGALVIKGVKTLPQDMSAALGAALLPGPLPQ